MGCVICGDERGDGVCPVCEREGYTELPCGCTVDPGGMLQVSTACQRHTERDQWASERAMTALMNALGKAMQR